LVNGLHHTGLTVTDLDRSLAFYRDLLGLEVVMTQERRGGYFAAIVGYPDAHVRMAHVQAPASEHRLELFQYLSPEPLRAAVEPCTVGLTHVCLTVGDLRGLYDRLGEAGVESFFSPPVDVDAGVNAGASALYLRDPDGAIVELFEPATA
jgi:catechol 2,3-dioxygenase-like lactoylglutathione lyase family enzyme